MDNTLITQDRLDSLVTLCSRTPPGAIVEVGVYKGGSLKFLAEAFPDRHLAGIDTFEGLPKEQWNENEVHQPGDFADTSIEAVYKFISLPNVELIKGLFPHSMEAQEGKLDCSFVHVDTDFYEGVKACLEYFYPSLPPGGIMVFDDYEWPNCPGVKKALEEFGVPIQKSVNFQAYIVKQ